MMKENGSRYHTGTKAPQSFFNKDFAILYRTNAQSRSFEESLRRMGIPYRIYGGMSFYQRKEIKDFIAYLRLIVNLQDEEALKRIINFPARELEKRQLIKLFFMPMSITLGYGMFWKMLRCMASEAVHWKALIILLSP